MQRIHATAFVAPGVQVYGRVEIAEHCSLWPQAVIRAEAMHVRIERLTNVQDFCMLHVGYDAATEIGPFCSVTHHATVHGARIEEACLVGIAAVVMDGAVVGRGSIVAPGAVVPIGMAVPPHSIVAGVPARVIKQRDCERENRLNAWLYHRNATGYARGAHRRWDGAEHRDWLRWIEAEVAADRDLAPDFDPRVA